jgi:hypothetical protein
MTMVAMTRVPPNHPYPTYRRFGCVWFSVVESGTTGLEAYLQHTTSEEYEDDAPNLYYKWVLSLYSATCMLLGNYYAVSDETVEWWVHISALLIGAILQGARRDEGGGGGGGSMPSCDLLCISK